MLPASFCPDGTYDLVRLGRDHAGGYLVETQSLYHTTRLLTFGLSGDWSFEKDFLYRRPVPMAAYGHALTQMHLLRQILLSFLQMLVFRKSVSAVLESLWKPVDYRRFFRGDAVHHRVKVGGCDAAARPLGRILEELRMTLHPSVFLKADIAGSEYGVLDDLAQHAERFCGLVLTCREADVHRARIESFIRDFPLALVHVHGRPGGVGGDAQGDPTVLEMTFARDPHRVSEEPSLPHPLDRPACKRGKELALKFQPPQA